MNAFAEVAAQWAADTVFLPALLWSGLAVLLLMALTKLGDRWARLKSDVLVAAIVALPLAVLVPSGALTISSAYAPSLTATRAPAGVSEPVLSAKSPQPRPRSSAAQTPLAQSPPTVPMNALRLAVLLWMLGALLILSRLTQGAVHLRGLVENAALAGTTSDGIQIRKSPEIKVPFAAGLLRPVIMLPLELSDEESVLRHEAAHVTEGDIWALRVTLLIRALFWPHPLVWVMMRMAAVNREIACDAVSCQNADPVTYAQMLRAFAVHGASIEPAMAGSHDLHYRLRALGNAPPTASKRVVLVPALALALLVGMASCRIQPVQEPSASMADLGAGPISVIFKGDAELPHMQEALRFSGLRPYDADWRGVRPVTVELSRQSPLTTAEAKALHGNRAVRQMKLKPGRDSICLARKGAADDFMVVVEFDYGTSAEEARSIVTEAASVTICDVRKVANWVRIGNVPQEKRAEAVEKLLEQPAVVAVDGVASRVDQELYSTEWTTISASTVELEVPGGWIVSERHVGEMGFSHLRVQAPFEDLSIQIETREGTKMSPNQERQWGEQAYLSQIRHAREITEIEAILQDPEAKSEGAVVVEAAGATYYASYATKGTLRYVVLVGGNTGGRFPDLLRMIQSIRFHEGTVANQLDATARARHEALVLPVEFAIDAFYDLVNAEAPGQNPDPAALATARHLAEAARSQLEDALGYSVELFGPRQMNPGDDSVVGRMQFMAHQAFRFSTDYGDAFANRVSDPDRYGDIKYQLAAWDHNVKGFRGTWLGDD